MKVAVYDHYWSTMGGGEQFAGGIAAALDGEHDVTLVGPDALDAERFAERLGMVLGHLPFRRIDQASDVTELSSAFDLLINCTYQSTVVNRARHGLYVVHFPGKVPGPKQRWLDRARAALGRRLPPTVVLRSGFYQADQRGAGRRTDGAAVVDLYEPAGVQVGLDVRAERAATVRLWDRRTLLAESRLDAGATATLTFTTTGAWPQQVTVESDTYRHEARPGVVWRYGVLLESVTLAGRCLPAPEDRLRTKVLPPERLGHLRTYETIASNSHFTATWVERLWGRPSQVLYPPVRCIAPGPKEPLILTIGRFFDPRRGHSKKQLELVEAFRRLVAGGRFPGWSLHLVGGCSPEDRDYAMAVKRAALGAPISVHLNAPGAVVDGLLARASVYWHAGGLGEDPETHPDRFEHFGISVVEAMSAGLVPVVFDAAGPSEVVRADVDGLRFRTVDELVSMTAGLIDAPDRRCRFGASAVERAEDFAPAAFRRRLLQLLDENGLS